MICSSMLLVRRSASSRLRYPHPAHRTRFRRQVVAGGGAASSSSAGPLHGHHAFATSDVHDEEDVRGSSSGSATSAAAAAAAAAGVQTPPCTGAVLRTIPHCSSPSPFGTRSRADTAPARSYHTTPRNEILPLVALAVTGLTIRYSYKALRRMDQEWEQYEERMREFRDDYREEHGIDFDEGGYEGDAEVHASATATSKADAVLFKGGTVGIDLGTVNLRLSHRAADGAAKTADGGGAHVVVDRDGGRSTPNSLYFDDDGEAVVGRLASSKAFERGGVMNPHSLIGSTSADDEDEDGGRVRDRAVAEVIRSAAQNALEQTLGSRHVLRPGRRGGALFALDAGSSSGGYDARPVFTYPPVSSHESAAAAEAAAAADTYQSRYQNAISSLSEPEGIALFVPEPVAAVLGAVSHGVMPEVKGTVMVIDVGGTATSVSLVVAPPSPSPPPPPSSSSDCGDLDVVHSSRLDGLGGETLIDALVAHLVRSFYGQPVEEVDDGMALQRLYDASRSAVLELGSGGKDRVQINVPYLSVDEKMQPRHLDLGVGRAVLEQELAGLVASRAGRYGRQNVLSTSLGVNPTKDLRSLFSSLAMRVLEESGLNPFGLERILIVGGGVRSPIYREAIVEGLSNLGGPQFVEERVVVPEGELAEELVVLGAASVGGR